MKLDIILAGVGGQGILSIAAVLGHAALHSGLHLKQAEVHGMSQRGGAVQSHMRISDRPIHSDLVPLGGAEIVLSVEPLESLRYVSYLSATGWLVTNITPFDNISSYPPVSEILDEIEALPRSLTVDADAIARQLKNRLAMNMVMAGAASPYLELPFEALAVGVERVFERKGHEVVAANIAALEAGRDYARSRVS